MASTYLSRTFSASPTSDKIITFSLWFKRSGLGEQHIFGNRASDNSRSHLYFDANDRFNILGKKTDGSGNNSIDITTTKKFRDTNGFYNLVVAIDTTQATTANRVKLYVNGVLETSLAQEVNPSQNDVLQLNKDLAHEIGSYDGSNYYFDGYMSHIHFIDGTQYAASAFGETDSNGVWKIKTSPSVTYGNHGFFILKDGNSVTDQSGNSNNWAVTAGTLTDDKDNPSNVFCTMNPLDNYFASSTFSNGNNTIVTNNSNYTWNTGTLGMTSGKFYWEVKYAANSNTEYYNLVGIADRPTDDIHDPLGRQTDCSNYGYYANSGGVYAKSTSATTFGNSWTVGDIIGVAVDLDNNKLYFSKNGTWQNSGVPTSGSTGTGAISIDAISSTTTGVYFPASGDWGSSQYVTNQHNFGNGRFGTTAVSSAGTNASGNGVFEYDVPTGYTALCTKGLDS